MHLKWRPLYILVLKYFRGERYLDDMEDSDQYRCRLIYLKQTDEDESTRRLNQSSDKYWEDYH